MKTGRSLLMPASFLCSTVFLFCAGNARATQNDDAAFRALGEEFASQTAPSLRRYCLECHATADPAGELDLERFAGLAEVRGDTKVWIKVAEMLDNGEMPPQDAEQPNQDERRQLRDWVERYLHAEAYAQAGDPGPVALRRLNNAEYTYTIQDLTGVALKPAREFPADGAAGEGFTNATAAMAMSPAMLTKYLDAAKEIAQHAVLLPEGIRFSAATTRRDWTNETLATIRAIYRRHSDAGGASQVDLQGIVFDTNDGGRLPVESYLAATVEERDALQAGERTISDVAESRGLNAKYLGTLWSALQEEMPSPPLDKIRAQWRTATPSDAGALAAEIGAWQNALWRFTSVGHIGKVGGPKAWQEPVAPLVARQELRLSIPATPDQREVTLYLVAGDAGDGAENDVVIWERPRLIAPDKSEILLHDVRRWAREHASAESQERDYGIDPVLFGRRPDGRLIDADSLCVQAPVVLEVVLPANLVAGYELLVEGFLAPDVGVEGSVQLSVLTTKPGATSGLQASTTTITDVNGAWTSDNQQIAHGAPVVASDGSAARARFEAGFDRFRALFPAALCYTKIVPVDEVVTLTQFYREDEALRRLMLEETETRELDRLWEELHFVSQDALTQVDGLEQLIQFATQDADPSVFEPLRQPFAERALAFRRQLIDAEPRQLAAVIEFASQAYRRPLDDGESIELRDLYQRLRGEELPHDEALRFLLARIFVSPAFLYRLEELPGGEVKPEGDGRIPSQAVADRELASRLSYFLWSSQPDEALREVAEAGRLHESAELTAQARRMIQDPRIERFAEEFGCQWLQIYEFDVLDEKSERHFPEFAELRGDMYEEAIRFFADVVKRDASMLSLFDADHTIANERLAKFYGVPWNAATNGVASLEVANPWRQVAGLRAQGRGGVLGLAATLAKQSGASRTSPILRGNWVSEVLLGEKLPKPPAGVPVLPDDESATAELTVRQLVEKHTSDEKCATCHRRIDPLGFALEAFDAIGRRREHDLAQRPIDAKTTLPDGTTIDGLPGLRDYLVNTRRDAVVRQFCRKLLGYALGRSVQLSDAPLLDEMSARLARHDYRLSEAIESIIQSNQFRAIRVGDWTE